MANTLFDGPLFLRKQRYVQELASLEDVFDFLDEWTDEQRDATCEVIEKACRMAAQGIFPVPAFKKTFAGS